MNPGLNNLIAALIALYAAIITSAFFPSHLFPTTTVCPTYPIYPSICTPISIFTTSPSFNTIEFSTGL